MKGLDPWHQAQGFHTHPDLGTISYEGANFFSTLSDYFKIPQPLALDIFCNQPVGRNDAIAVLGRMQRGFALYLTESPE